MTAPVVYHRGHLARDRLRHEWLHELAEDYLAKATPKGQLVRRYGPAVRARDRRLGTGEGVLLQRRARAGNFEYLYVPRA